MQAKKYGKIALPLLCVLATVYFLFTFLISPKIRNENVAFEAFTEELFTTEIASNTLNLHYMLAEPESYGIHPKKVSLGNASLEAKKKGMKELSAYQKKLHTFSPENLNPHNQLTYEILDLQFSYELALEPFLLYEESLGPTTGIQAQLPVLLAEYAFYEEEDIQTYLSLLSQVDTYFAELLAFEQEKSAAGLFMADYAVNDILSQCQKFLTSPQDNYLLELFDTKIENLKELPADRKQTYQKQHEKVLSEHVIPAYELLMEGLTALKGTGTNPYGLCHYPEGKAYYEALIKATIGTERTMEEIKAMLGEQLLSDYQTLAALLEQNPALATAENLLAPLEPAAILQDLKIRIGKDFPSIPDTACEIKYVPASLAEHLSPAFYLTPPIDKMDSHTIYVNQASNYDYLSLFTTLAHEGYPGHLYQTLYENQLQLDPVRNLFYFGGYTEGWATYVEHYAYSMAPIPKEKAALMAANSSILLCLYANADIGIHFDGWTPEDTVNYFASFGIKDQTIVTSIYHAIVESPANYLKYYLGNLEICKLKEQAHAALSDKFVLKDFHEFLLTIGPAPFPIFYQYMPAWLDALEVTRQSS